MKIERTATFKRNYKSLKKKNYDMKKFEAVLNHLINRDKTTLTSKYKDYSLSGNLKNFRELHIERDWLLVYQIKNDELVLLLIATGSHDEVFRNSSTYK